MSEGLYILSMVLVFGVLYLNQSLGFLSTGVQGCFFHAELLLMLLYVIYRIRKMD